MIDAMTNKIGPAAIALVVFVGCGATQPASRDASSASVAAVPSSHAPKHQHAHDEAHGPHGRGHVSGHRHASGGGAAPSGRKARSHTPAPAASGPSNGGTVAYPAAGTYVYAQSGTEEFCAGGRCDREQLPPTQRELTKITAHNADRTTIVSEVRPAKGRYVRTTFDYSDDVAAITEVYYSFDYNGFSFSDDYKPDPPVRSILFPLTVGRSWSGSWKAKTSGTYAMKVASSETVSVNGRDTRAFKLETNEHFSGEYRGTAAVTVWVDPATKAVVKTSGALHLENSIGSYDTTLTTVLRSGPSYG